MPKQVHLFSFVVVILLVVTLQCYAQSGKVISVKDGDTIVLLSGDKQYTIRLNGIDAPEKNQPFGNKAKQLLGSLIFGKEVTAEITGQDRYGRNLGKIFLDKVNINLQMLKEGYAWHYKQYDRNPAYSQAEISARNSKLGLWADSNPVPPWEFRHGNKSIKASKTESRIKDNYTSGRCQATTKKGTQCKRNSQSGSKYCWQHQ